MAIFDTEGMKSGAASIEQELKQYQRAKETVDRILEQMEKSQWKDDVSRRFCSRYKNEAKVLSENLEKIIIDIAKLLHQCAQKYSNAIDNGNSNLSS